MSLGQYIIGYAQGGPDEAEERVKETSLAYNMSGMAAADAAEEQSQRVADAQQRALDYMMSVEEIPQQYRSASTEQLGFLYGMGTPEQQSAAYSQYMDSPIRENVLRGLEAGEEAILRRQSATGGLRSGASQDMLAGLSADLEQQAFDRYLGGLGGLAQLQTRPEEIASGYTNIAETLASGQLAGAQAQQQGMGQLGSLAGAALMAFSDPSLKTNIKVVGSIKGLPWCTWDWCEKAIPLGLTGSGCGVMADDVERVYPHLAGEHLGYKTVNYEGLIYGC